MIVRICPNCKSENDAGDTNCHQCGTSLIGEKMIYKADSNEGNNAQTPSAASQENMVSESNEIQVAATDTSRPVQSPAVLEMAVLQRKLRSGASWFYWIAAMTLINSILIRTATNRTFIIGLGATILTDVFSTNLAVEQPEMALVWTISGILVDLVAVGLFIWFGYASGKRRLTSYLIGIVLYSLDSLIYLLVGDIFSLLFHGLALYYLISGYRAGKKLDKMQQAVIDI